jgi:hypothetical protein
MKTKTRGEICRFWMEEDREICKASNKACSCGADPWYCDWPAERRKKILERSSNGKSIKKVSK